MLATYCVSVVLYVMKQPKGMFSASNLFYLKCLPCALTSLSDLPDVFKSFVTITITNSSLIKPSINYGRDIHRGLFFKFVSALT